MNKDSRIWYHMLIASLFTLQEIHSIDPLKILQSITIMSLEMDWIIISILS